MRIALGARLIRAIVGLVSRTARIDASGARDLDRFARDAGPVILVLWHEGLVFLSGFLARRLLRRGVDLTVFASRSRDGELGARLVALWGGRVVRGSATRGGLEGLRALHRSITRDGSSTVITPDGPTGPRRVAKAGAVVLAQMSGAPLVPIAYAARHGRRLGSWDRMLVPWPFTRIAVTVGRPLEVPRELDGDAIEQWRQRLEAALNDTGRAAAERIGVPPGT